MLEAVYRQWRGVLWRRQVLLSCKLINKCFKKKVRFLFGQTTYIGHAAYTTTVYNMMLWYNSSHLHSAYIHYVRYMQHFYPGKFCCLEVSIGTVVRLMFGYKHGTNSSPWDEAIWIGTATPVSYVKRHFTTARCRSEFQNYILHAWNVGNWW
jgi:hypothetical protein